MRLSGLTPLSGRCAREPNSSSASEGKLDYDPDVSLRSIGADEPTPSCEYERRRTKDSLMPEINELPEGGEGGGRFPWGGRPPGVAELPYGPRWATRMAGVTAAPLVREMLRLSARLHRLETAQFLQSVAGSPMRSVAAAYYNPAELPEGGEGGEGGGGLVFGEFPGEFPAELPWYDRFTELETQVAQLTEMVGRLVEQMGETEG
jgi:hypothetical protein